MILCCISSDLRSFFSHRKYPRIECSISQHLTTPLQKPYLIYKKGVSWGLCINHMLSQIKGWLYLEAKAYELNLLIICNHVRCN